MIRMFVRHPVADFATWKQAYEAFADERKGLGVVGDAVFKSADDPNDVTVWHDFETIESANAFAESKRLREINAELASAIDAQPSAKATSPPPYAFFSATQRCHRDAFSTACRSASLAHAPLLLMSEILRSISTIGQ